MAWADAAAVLALAAAHGVEVGWYALTAGGPRAAGRASTRRRS